MSKRKRKRKNQVTLFLALWRLGRHHPVFLLLLVLGGGSWYSYEIYYARPEMVYMGVPQAQDWQNPLTWTRVFRNKGFMVGYSDIRGNPLWVSYRIEPVPDGTPYYERPPRFSSDWRNLTYITHDTYNNSGYDRGHMAPNYAISRLYGRVAQLDTFLMTNVTPQRPKLNQKLWQRLEEVEIDYFATQFGEVWVLTGPIFDNNIERLKSSYRVEIPDAFYKIFVVPPTESSQTPRMLAFIVPQYVRGTEPLDRFVVSVNEVEQQTGFDFFHEIEDALEEKLETKIDPAAWQLKAVARRPPRY
jgi:endonuclease G, mitochondrial